LQEVQGYLQKGIAQLKAVLAHLDAHRAEQLANQDVYNQMNGKCIIRACNAGRRAPWPGASA
jgi:hypothetical protein